MKSRESSVLNIRQSIINLTKQEGFNEIRQSHSFFYTSDYLAAAAQVSPHCEIPCGIYDDQARITLLKEHITTIEKSMDQIEELQSKQDKDYNQLVRWIVNKEDHAEKLMGIVTQYFMTQRIKPAQPYPRIG